MPALQPAPKPELDLPDHVAKDIDVIGFLQKEVEKSGELYLKVALWKVFLRLPQHCEDLMVAENKPGIEVVKQLFVRLMNYSASLITEGRQEGGLDQKKHGVTEEIVRENILWLREKFTILEMQITDARKSHILDTIFGA